jgi:hypothetical protein
LDFGSVIRLAFYARRGSPPLAVADLDPSGCGGVRLAVHGKRWPALAGVSTKKLERVLGVTLKTGVS